MNIRALEARLAERQAAKEAATRAATKYAFAGDVAALETYSSDCVQCLCMVVLTSSTACCPFPPKGGAARLQSAPPLPLTQLTSELRADQIKCRGLRKLQRQMRRDEREMLQVMRIYSPL